MVAQSISDAILIGVSSNFLSGISLFLAAWAAWYTAVRVTKRIAEKDLAHRKDAEDRRVEAAKRDALVRATKTFQILYQELWQNEDATFVRRTIVNDQEYNEVECILAKRNATKNNTLTRQENDMIEKIDRFCSILVRIKSFVECEDIDDRQSALWMKLLGNFWIKKIKENRREFYKYILNHWSELDQEIPASATDTLPMSNTKTAARRAGFSPRPAHSEIRYG